MEKGLSMKLFNYYRSSASYRVRIALNYKNINFETQDVLLVDSDLKKAEQHSEFYKNINPQALVPSLQLDNNQKILSQSLAILEYLEEEYPSPSILPENKIDRSYVRQLANIIACDMHPLNNLRVLQYLKNNFNITEEQKITWYHHWLNLGFQSIEELLKNNNSNGKFCFGDEITIADICLIPQVYNANRFEFDLSQFELISSINSNCLKIECFDLTKP